MTHDHWLRVDASLDESATGFFTLREVTTGDRPAAGSTALMLEVDAPDCLEFEVLDLHAGTSSFTAWCRDDAASLGGIPEGGFILLLPALAAGVRRRSHDA